MELQVKDITGKIVGSVEADDRVWGAEANTSLLHQAVIAQQANKRQGTHSTLTRGEVSYSTRKLRAQKGTGRARLGSRKAPTLRGGGVAHGPHPRSYSQKLPKKMKRQALRVALSDHIRGESLTVLDILAFDKPKTTAIADLVKACEISGKALIVTADKNDTLIKSCANLPAIRVIEARNLSPLDTVGAKSLVITKDAVKVVDTIWGEEASK
jgi:large subunit ribosomal protein L4